MNRNRHRPVCLLAAAALHALALGGCRATPSVREAFDHIQPGMSCAEVEAVLGPPLLRYSTVAPPRIGNDEAWYLPPPALDTFESPWGPGTLCVVYSVDDCVLAKRLNPQWRESPVEARDQPLPWTHRTDANGTPTGVGPWQPEPVHATNLWVGKNEAEVHRVYAAIAIDRGTVHWGGSGDHTFWFALGDGTQVWFDADFVGTVFAAGGPQPKTHWQRFADGSILVAEGPR